jgi:glutaredoxin
MNIVIYSKPNCSWCVKAKELMNKLNLKYDEKKLDEDYTRDYLRALIYGDSPASLNPPLTVPQIFVNNKRVGGYEDFADWCDNHGYGNGQ